MKQPWLPPVAVSPCCPQPMPVTPRDSRFLLQSWGTRTKPPTRCREPAATGPSCSLVASVPGTGGHRGPASRMCPAGQGTRFTRPG